MKLNNLKPKIGNGHDWWKVTGLLMLISAFTVMVDNFMMGEIFDSLFEGGILFILGIFLQKKSKKAFYITWFLTLVGFAAMLAGYDTPTTINPFVGTILNIASIGSLVMLTFDNQNRSG